MKKTYQVGKIPLVLLLIVTTIGVVAGVLLVLRNQDIREKAAPATTLSISPSTQNKFAGDTFNLNVVMDTGANQVSGADIIINFDSQKLQINSLTKGTAAGAFQEIKNTIDNNAGKAYFSIYSADTSKALNGQGLNVLVITGSVKPAAAPGTYNLTFDAATAVAGLGEGQNVLSQPNLGSIVVQAQAGQPTNTPTPTATGSGSKTPTPTPTSTSSSSGTKTATPTATATSAPAGTQSAQTTPLPIPVTGTDWPTIGGIGLGIMVIIGSLLIAL